MVSTPLRVKAIFLEAVELADLAARSAFLDTACAGDTGLRARVERLLSSHDQAAHPTPAASHDDDTTRELPPERLPSVFTVPLGSTVGSVIAGRYRLVDKLGEGGMGEVWRADQSEPVKRQVALKLLHAGMDTRSVNARFEGERQTLALMDHPNIARIYDGGTCGRQSFFVMELVKGVSITRYCDEHQLALRERLALFVPVCLAIQHAHQKGIIHRDIKPNNVLVTQYDGRPVAKVIDFGIAKATAGQHLDLGSHTQFGMIVGTPQYMSPEQADTRQSDIDTRSDIYSLGVLLYELLAGSPPFDREVIGSIPLLELLRKIREEEPPPPSARLRNTAELSEIAAGRGVDPKRLPTLVRGELDWIVMTALEKDRERRYPTATALVDDIQRYLAGEVVQACPPSATYRARKFLRRHRGAVLAASLVWLTLVGGIVGTSVGMVRAREATRAERTAKLLAEKRADQNKAAVESLGGIFTNLDVREERRTGKQLRIALGERLAKVAANLDGDTVADPASVAELQQSLGNALRGLGLHESAQKVLAKSYDFSRSHLGPDDGQTLRAQTNLAVVLSEQKKFADARPLVDDVIARRMRLLGPGHPETLVVRNNLATILNQTGQPAEAVAILEEIIPLQRIAPGPGHHETHGSMNNLAMAYKALGRMDDAGRVMRDALNLRIEHAGPDDPDTLTVRHNLGHFLTSTNQLDAALPVVEETLRRVRAVYGPEHPLSLDALQLLTNIHRAAGRFAQAAALGEELVRHSKRANPSPNHELTVTALYYTGTDYLRSGQYPKAERYLQECWPRYCELAPNHHLTFIIETMLGQSLIVGPDPAKAERHLLHGYEGLKQRERQLPADQRTVALDEAIGRLIQFYKRTENTDQLAEWTARREELASKPKN